MGCPSAWQCHMIANRMSPGVGPPIHYDIAIEQAGLVGRSRAPPNKTESLVLVILKCKFDGARKRAIKPSIAFYRGPMPIGVIGHITIVNQHCIIERRLRQRQRHGGIRNSRPCWQASSDIHHQVSHMLHDARQSECKQVEKVG